MPTQRVCSARSSLESCGVSRVRRVILCASKSIGFKAFEPYSYICGDNSDGIPLPDPQVLLISVFVCR